MRRLIEPRDVAIATGFTIAGQVELHLLSAAGSKALDSLPVLGATLALALRTRNPLACALLVPAFTLALASTGRETGDLVPFAAMVLAAGSYGHNARGRAAHPLVAAGWAAAVLLMGLPAAPLNEVAGLVVILAAAWVGGRLVHQRGETVEQLRVATSRLEREREARARAAVAEERARIARELHDIVAHSVSVMVLQSGVARQLLQRDVGRATETLIAVEDTGRDALVEMKRLVGIMRAGAEPELAPSPGLDNVDELVSRARATGLSVDLRVEGERREIPPGLALTCYRVLQEAITNAIKHAGRANVGVTVRFGDADVELTVVDDGPGPEGQPGEGHGLLGMRERVALYGGELTSGPRDGRGFAVRARLPFKDARA